MTIPDVEILAVRLSAIWLAAMHSVTDGQTNRPTNDTTVLVLRAVTAARSATNDNT